MCARVPKQSQHDDNLRPPHRCMTPIYIYIASKQIASNFNASSNMKFPVSQRFVRDHLVLHLISIYKLEQKTSVYISDKEQIEMFYLVYQIHTSNCPGLSTS